MLNFILQTLFQSTQRHLWEKRRIQIQIHTLTNTGRTKTCGSGSPTMETRKEIHFVSESRKGRGDLLETYIQCITKNNLSESVWVLYLLKNRPRDCSFLPRASCVKFYANHWIWYTTVPYKYKYEYLLCKNFSSMLSTLNRYSFRFIMASYLLLSKICSSQRSTGQWTGDQLQAQYSLDFSQL